MAKITTWFFLFSREPVGLSVFSDDETDLIRELQTMCSSKSEPDISKVQSPVTIGSPWFIRLVSVHIHATTTMLYKWSIYVQMLSSLQQLRTTHWLLTGWPVSVRWIILTFSDTGFIIQLLVHYKATNRKILNHWHLKDWILRTNQTRLSMKTTSTCLLPPGGHKMTAPQKFSWFLQVI